MATGPSRRGSLQLVAYGWGKTLVYYFNHYLKLQDILATSAESCRDFFSSHPSTSYMWICWGCHEDGVQEPLGFELTFFIVGRSASKSIERSEIFFCWWFPDEGAQELISAELQRDEATVEA